MIDFITQNRKILVSVFLTIGMLNALVDVVILTQRTQIFRSRASSSEVIFKNTSGEVLPLNKDKQPISDSLEVIVELNPQTRPSSYKIAKDLTELTRIESNTYTTHPLRLNYKFQKVQNNVPTLFVEFFYSDGSSKKIVSTVEISNLGNVIGHYTSPKGFYELSYDKRQWVYTLMPDETFGQRTIFNLSNEYGFARLDIIEYESTKDLVSLVNEIISLNKAKPVTAEPVQFGTIPSYIINYKEQILGQDTYFYQQVIKDGNKVLILEKRVATLGYNAPYLENLLQSLIFADVQPQQIKGATSFPEDLPSPLTTDQLVDLVRPSIAHIVYTYCLDIVNLKPALSGLSKPQYQFCASGKGSGFIVNEKGIVATNGHVVKVFPQEALIANLLQEEGKIFAIDLVKALYISKGQTPTQTEIEDVYKQLGSNPQYIDRFLTEIFELIEKKIITVSINNEKYYVNVGKDPVKVDYQKMLEGDYVNAVIPSSTTYTAKLLDVDFPNRYSYEAIINKNYHRGPDVAILQIENPSNNVFVALELGSTQNLKEGLDVVVAGYPTLVEGEEDPRASISYKTSTKPTITKGIVSAIKEDLTGKTVFQTDASIDHGNSGGPAFNPSGQVIGIATFTVESKTGNFNFLRDITELKQLMTKNNIENSSGTITTFWREGLHQFRLARYNQAIGQFKKVEALSPSHPTIQEFIQNSKKAIQEGKSLEGFAGFWKSQQTANVALVTFGSISIISFMLAGFLTALPLFARDSTPPTPTFT